MRIIRDASAHRVGKGREPLALNRVENLLNTNFLRGYTENYFYAHRRDTIWKNFLCIFSLILSRFTLM
jgi:hypothetical protein